MATASNGGRVALCGYLYQIIGMLGLHAHINQSTENQDELEAQLTFIAPEHGQRIQHEALDQDAMLGGLGIGEDDRCVLVQFKFSAISTTLDTGDLKKIVRSFARSADRARKKGLSISRYVVVTNRPLTEPVEQCLCQIKQGCFPTELEQSHRDVLENLTVISELGTPTWTDRLRSFAAEYGATDYETNQGITTLIGEVLRETSEKADVSIHVTDLVKAFTNERDANRLIANCVLPMSKAQVADFRDKLGIKNTPVDREIIERILEASAGRGLVVLYGKGGCGKSVALSQWAFTLISAEGSGAFTDLQGGLHIPNDWIVGAIWKWRGINLIRSSSDSPHEAIKRLERANPELGRPLLHLGLDDLDEESESHDQRAIVRQIINEAWEEDKRSQQQAIPPHFTLVVTCRDWHSVVQKWLDLERSGFPYPLDEDQLLTIRVDEFTDDELAELARNNLSSADYELIASHMYPYEPNPTLGHTAPPTHVTRQLELQPIGSPQFSSGDPQIIDALRDPALWRSFLELNADDRSATLRGDQEGVREICSVYVNRFLKKARSRDLKLYDYLESDLRDALLSIARNSYQQDQDIQDTKGGWITPACEHSPLEHQTAMRLHREALSGGLINDHNNSQWAWRHQFLRDALAAGWPDGEESI